jgi:hypothetical protein
MNSKQLFVFFLAAIFMVQTGCSSKPRIIVNQSSVSDQELYEKDFNGCYEIAKTFDLNNEKAAKGLAGAAIGGTAVAGIASAVAGAVFAPAIPFIIAGSLAGGGLWGASASKEEKTARENIMVQCLKDKGYEVYSTS